MQTTVSLTKEEKLKKLNQKLNNMLKDKNCDPLKIGQKPVPLPPSEQQNQKKKEQPSNKSQQSKSELPKTKKIHKEQKKDQKHLRKAAGLVWQDKSMQDWPQNDYRVFCGNLGNEVNDEMLASVFRHFRSFQMARVIRDKRTGKTRGFGFISFKEPQDFLNVLKTMNGKYVGNRPVKLTKSSWKERQLESEKNKMLPSDFKTNSQKQTNKICVNYKYISPL